MTAGGGRRVVLQFEDVLVILRDPGVASPGGECSLHRNRRGEVGGDLAVADAAPLEMRFVDHARVDHHRVADLDGIFLIVYVECLLRKVELTRTIRGGD